jgi:transcriptional regulator with XRE-family HTH domain
METKIRKSKYKRVNKEGEAILVYIQNQVKKERIAHNLSQRKLSHEVDRSNNWATRLENGELLPDILDIIALSVIFKKPISYFLPTRYRDKPGEITLEEMKEERRKAIEALSKLTEEN